MSALRETCSGLPDKRRGTNCRYVMADIGMAAFSVFFMQSPSFLAHQRHLADGYGHGRSNCETLFGMERIPSDNHVRDMLDPMAPECFHALFPRAVKALEAGGGLTAFRRLGDHVLIAFDGTEYHRSTKLHCACCSTRKRSGGTTEYFHALVAATLQPGGAAGARVRRAAGWARQAGLREHGGATLARRPRPELRKARSCLSRRR